LQTPKTRVPINFRFRTNQQIFKGREDSDDTDLRQKSLGARDFLCDVLPKRMPTPRLAEGGQFENPSLGPSWLFLSNHAKSSHGDFHIAIKFLAKAMKE
jgi:hypothetical protein